MRTLLVAIHGILTNQTDPSWPDKLDAWMFDQAPDIKVLKKEYRAGPFPKWNCWIKDPALAKSLANEIELFLLPCSNRGDEALISSSIEQPESSISPPSIWFVSHSNGAVIALLTAKILIQRGHKIGGLILTGAACEADIEKNNVAQWLANNDLGLAIAYASPDDEALPGPTANVFRRIYNVLARPYGSLGKTGWTFQGVTIENQKSKIKNLNDRVFTRSFKGGHSTYFTPDHIESTFEQILSDIQSHTSNRSNVPSTMIGRGPG